MPNQCCDPSCSNKPYRHPTHGTLRYCFVHYRAIADEQFLHRQNEGEWRWKVGEDSAEGRTLWHPLPDNDPRLLAAEGKYPKSHGINAKHRWKSGKVRRYGSQDRSPLDADLYGGQRRPSRQPDHSSRQTTDNRHAGRYAYAQRDPLRRMGQQEQCWCCEQPKDAEPRTDVDRHAIVPVADGNGFSLAPDIRLTKGGRKIHGVLRSLTGQKLHEEESQHTEIWSGRSGHKSDPHKTEAAPKNIGQDVLPPPPGGWLPEDIPSLSRYIESVTKSKLATWTRKDHSGRDSGIPVLKSDKTRKRKIHVLILKDGATLGEPRGYPWREKKRTQREQRPREEVQDYMAELKIQAAGK